MDRGLYRWELNRGQSFLTAVKGLASEERENTPEILVSSETLSLTEQEFFEWIQGKKRLEELEAEGWICWDETASAVPTQGVGTNTYANQVIKRISGNHTRVYLTLDASSETARVLPTLLRRLAEEGYGVSVPLETRL